MLDSIRKSAESWGVKVLFGVIIVVFVLGYGMMGNDQGGSQVLALINDQPLMIEEYAQVHRRILDNQRQQNPNITAEDLRQQQFRMRVFQGMVQDILLLQAAAALNITVSPAELQEAIKNDENFHDENQRFSERRYQQLLRQNRIEPAQYEQDLLRSMIIGKLQKYVTLPATVSETEAREAYDFHMQKRTVEYLAVDAVDFFNATDPTDEEISTWYEENKDRFLVPPSVTVDHIVFTPQALAENYEITPEEAEEYYQAYKDTEFQQEEQVKASHILIQLEEGASDAAWEEAKTRIEEIRQNLVDGADFAELAKEFSDCPSSFQGGDLGWFGRGRMVPEFEETAFSLKPGEISQPVRTQFGWHLIKVEDHQEATAIPFEDAKEEIMTTMAQDKASDDLEKLLNYSMDLVLSDMPLADVAKEKNLPFVENETFTRDELTTAFGMDDATLDKLFAMAPGQTTLTPLSVENGFAFFTVKELTPATHKPLEEVKEIVADRVRFQHSQELAEQKAREMLDAINENGLTDEDKEALAKSDPFGRQGFIPGLGLSMELVTDTFASEMDKWLPGVYPTDIGYVIARVVDEAPPTEEEWETQKEQVLQILTEEEQKKLYTAYLQDLQEKAEVKITKPELLQD